ncbi:MAG: hypothetical protein JJU12_08440 [Chlamydiales bacterium]|nr:hypothetical protein [Chlamydiales bacterium]
MTTVPTVGFESYPLRNQQESSQTGPSNLGGRKVSQVQGGYSCANALRAAAVALAVTTAVVGVLGLLVYNGNLNIGWQGLGNVSAQMGLYGALGGLGTSAILSILLTVSCRVNRAKQNSEKQHRLESEESDSETEN